MPRLLDRLGWAVAGAACLAFVAVAANLAGAGPLDPPGSPSSTMKTLDQVEPRYPITALPYNIAVPGSYYLPANLFGNTAGQSGITVSVSDVTIDLEGFTLRGGPGSVNGIVLTPGTKVVNVRNGTVSGWGGGGIVAGSAGSSLFEALSLVGNAQYGMLVGGDTADASNNIVRNCAASANGIGVQFAGSGLVEDCTVRNNTEGFVISGSGATLRNSTASTNQLTGATVSGVRNRIEGNNFTGNNTSNDGTSGAGLLVPGTNNIVVSNSASGNLMFDFKIGALNTAGTIQGPAPAPITEPSANVVY